MSEDPKWPSTRPLTAADYDETWRRVMDGEAFEGPRASYVVVSPREYEAMMSTAPTTEAVRAAYRNGLTLTTVNESRRERGVAEIPEAAWVGLTNRLLGRAP